jgi:hypothetical protein
VTGFIELKVYEQLYTCEGIVCYWELQRWSDEIVSEIGNVGWFLASFIAV